MKWISVTVAYISIMIIESKRILQQDRYERRIAHLKAKPSGQAHVTAQ